MLGIQKSLKVSQKEAKKPKIILKSLQMHAEKATSVPYNNTIEL